MSKEVRKIYTLYDDGCKMGQYSALEASALLKIPCASISSYASSGARAFGRYTFEPMESVEEQDPLAVEWDKVRNEILAAGRCKHGSGNGRTVSKVSSTGSSSII